MSAGLFFIGNHNLPAPLTNSEHSCAIHRVNLMTALVANELSHQPTYHDRIHLTKATVEANKIVITVADKAATTTLPQNLENLSDILNLLLIGIL